MTGRSPRAADPRARAVDSGPMADESKSRVAVLTEVSLLLAAVCAL